MSPGLLRIESCLARGRKGLAPHNKIGAVPRTSPFPVARLVVGTILLLVSGCGWPETSPPHQPGRLLASL